MILRKNKLDFINVAIFMFLVPIVKEIWICTKYTTKKPMSHKNLLEIPPERLGKGWSSALHGYQSCALEEVGV